MAVDWEIRGPWFKNCNCDPGCPCDFNQRPTKGFCEGLVAMRVDEGHFGDIDMAGVIWGGVVHWPGALHEGNGEVQPFVNDGTSEEQRNALFQILSGQHGDTLMEVFAFICPTVHEPIVAPIEFDFDLDSRSGKLKVGHLVESDVETLRGINPPEPYRIVVTIPNGMEYTGPNENAETALSKRIVSRGAIEFDIHDGHSTMSYVRHGNTIATGRHDPIVVAKAFD